MRFKILYVCLKFDFFFLRKTGWRWPPACEQTRFHSSISFFGIFLYWSFRLCSGYSLNRREILEYHDECVEHFFVFFLRFLKILFFWKNILIELKPYGCLRRKLDKKCNAIEFVHMHARTPQLSSQLLVRSTWPCAKLDELAGWAWDCKYIAVYK